MNRTKTLTLLLLIGLLSFALLSFAPCLTLSGRYYNSFYDTEPAAPKNVGYLPHFCCAITIIELMLLMDSKRWRRIVGMIHTILKTALPIPLMTFSEELMESSSTHYVKGSYSLNPPGYMILALGALNLLLYVLCISALSGQKLPAAPADPQPGQAPADPQPGQAPADPADQAAILAAMQRENKIFQTNINTIQGGKNNE